MVVYAVWGLTILYLIILLTIGLKATKVAEKSYDSFTIGEKSLPIYILIFTMFASVFGAGNFIGHADQAYSVGVKWLFFIFGESGAIFVFALTAASVASKYSYKTFPELIDEEYFSDRYVRAISGTIMALPGVAWLGGQAMGIGYIFELLTGTNATIVTLAALAVFITYTTLGGFVAVARADFFQGMFVLVTAVVFYFAAFNTIDFDLSVLGERLKTVDPTLWTFKVDNTWSLVSMFLTGTFGMFALSFWWQRCFASHNPKQARTMALISGILSIVFVPMTALVGLIARSNAPDLAGGSSAWLAFHISPILGVVMLVLLLSATISTADSLLNSAAINIVNDVIRPFKTDIEDQGLIKITRITSIGCGLVSILGTFYFTKILDLASFGYTVAGAVVIPIFFFGWLSKRTGKSVPVLHIRVALLLSAITSLAFQLHPRLSEILGGGIIPGAATCLLILLFGYVTGNRRK